MPLIQWPSGRRRWSSPSSRPGSPTGTRRRSRGSACRARAARRRSGRALGDGLLELVGAQRVDHAEDEFARRLSSRAALTRPSRRVTAASAGPRTWSPRGGGARARGRRSRPARVGRSAPKSSESPAIARAASTIAAAITPPPSARWAAAAAKSRDHDERARGDQRADRPSGPGRVVLGRQRRAEQDRGADRGDREQRAADRVAPTRRAGEHPGGDREADALTGGFEEVHRRRSVPDACMRETAPGWKPRTVTDPGRRRAAVAFDRPTPTPSRRRSGSTRRSGPRRAAAARGQTPKPTSRSSAAGSAGCGLRCSRRSASRRGEVILLERGRIADAASGRNGGFCSRFSPTGSHNGMARFPDEMPALERLGLANFAAIAASGRALRDRLRLRDRRRPRHRDRAARGRVAGRGGRGDARLGHEVELLDRDGVGEQLRSPLSLAAGSGADPGRRWSTRRGCAGALRGSRRRPACGSARDSRWRPPSVVTAALRCAPRAATVTRGGRCWRRAPSPASSARSAGVSCRSGTTCWSPSRSARRSARRSAGPIARASATSPTNSTTSG